jgi:uncharacterized protein (TIRG00374 family)
VPHPVVRWGTRSVALVVTAVGLYVVAPSLLELLGAWPELEVVRPRWFAVLGLLEVASFVFMWWLTRMALTTRRETDGPGATGRPGWLDVASAQLAGVAASRVLPGGAASAGVVQGRLLMQAGQPASTVARALTAVGLLSTAVLLSLPVLTVPALIVGPPPARQLQLGLLVSLVLAVVIVALGVAVLTWTSSVSFVGRMAGHLLKHVRGSVTPDSAAEALVAQRDRVAEVFERRWVRALGAGAAHRMLDYAALVAALYAVGVEARPSEVLLAYVVSMALAMVPLTPGGLGFVETGLTAMLVLVGAGADQAVLATLLYRLVSFWLPIPVGALAWAGWRLRRRGRPAERPTS